MKRKCLRCGTGENITRDHIIPRSVIRRQLTRDQYQQWSTEARFINIQPLCAQCNSLKGDTAWDYRDIEDKVSLLILARNWNLEVNWKEK